jgi:hypothetical protein
VIAGEVEVKDMAALEATTAAYHVPPHGPNDPSNVGDVLDKVLDWCTRRDF